MVHRSSPTTLKPGYRFAVMSNAFGIRKGSTGGERAPCCILQSAAPHSYRRHRHPHDRHQPQPQHQNQPTTTKSTPTIFTTIATAIMRICNPSAHHPRATTSPGGANLFPGNIIVTRTTTTTVSRDHHHHQSSDQQQQAQANSPPSQRQ
jgi:hypothetical protein